MDQLITLLAGLCAGIACGTGFFLIMKTMTSIEIAENKETDIPKKRLPVMIRLFLPLTPNLAKVNRMDSLSDYRKSTNGARAPCIPACTNWRATVLSNPIPATAMARCVVIIR